MSLFTNIFCRFLGIFIEKTTFEEFEEICGDIQYNDEKDIINSNFERISIEKYVPKHLISNQGSSKVFCGRTG